MAGKAQLIAGGPVGGWVGGWRLLALAHWLWHCDGVYHGQHRGLMVGQHRAGRGGSRLVVVEKVVLCWAGHWVVLQKSVSPGCREAQQGASERATGLLLTVSGWVCGRRRGERSGSVNSNPAVFDLRVCSTACHEGEAAARATLRL